MQQTTAAKLLVFLMKNKKKLHLIMNKEHKMASKNPLVKMILNLVVIINGNIANNSGIRFLIQNVFSIHDSW